MDLAILYWHFVDIVWVFLIRIIYGWGCAAPAPELSACADRNCSLATVLYEAKAYSFRHPAASNQTKLYIYILVYGSVAEWFKALAC